MKKDDSFLVYVVCSRSGDLYLHKMDAVESLASNPTTHS